MDGVVGRGGSLGAEEQAVAGATKTFSRLICSHSLQTSLQVCRSPLPISPLTQPFAGSSLGGRANERFGVCTGLFQRQLLGSSVSGLGFGSSASLQVSEGSAWGCGWSGSLGTGAGVSPVRYPGLSATAQVAENAEGGGGSEGRSPALVPHRRSPRSLFQPASPLRGDAQPGASPGWASPGWASPGLH